MTDYDDGPDMSIARAVTNLTDHAVSRVGSPRPWRMGNKVPQNIYDADDNPVTQTHAVTDAAVIVQCVNAQAIAMARLLSGPFPDLGDGILSRGHFPGTLGHSVVVTIEHARGEKPAVTVAGKLLGYSDDGEAIVLQDDGSVMRCWPALVIERTEIEAAQKMRADIDAADSDD
jgi:hypothetical protein